MSANADALFAINNNPHLSSSSTTIIYNAHQCRITTFTHGHHCPQHLLTTHNNHSTPQHNNNLAMPCHQPNKCQRGWHDAMSVVWQWWRATSSPSGCFQPPQWVTNHLAPPTAYYPGATLTVATMDTTMNSHLTPQCPGATSKIPTTLTRWWATWLFDWHWVNSLLALPSISTLGKH